MKTKKTVTTTKKVLVPLEMRMVRGGDSDTTNDRLPR
jgi:hypothetical protein